MGVPAGFEGLRSVQQVQQALGRVGESEHLVRSPRASRLGGRLGSGERVSAPRLKCMVGVGSELSPLPVAERYFLEARYARGLADPFS